MKRSPVLLTIFLTAITFTTFAQNEDSLRIARSHAEADSILRVITGRAPRPTASQPAIATPVAAPVHSDTPALPPTNGLSKSVADTPVSAPIQTQPAVVPAPPAGTTSAPATTGAPSAPPAPAQPQGAGQPTGRPQGQYPGATGGSVPGAPGSGGMKMSIGHIYGKLIDAQKKPVGYAAVSLVTMKDSLITGQLTEDNGDFSLTDLPFGAYNLKVTFIGYKDIVRKVVITPNKMEQDVGNLVMTADATKLKEVDVTATKSNMELKVDRKVFNVGSDLSVRGGTALDAMKNIPSVSTDADGNVTLRNNSPQIYVDGKPTTLTLEQIPADQIDKIEVITNPSAKFEAAASGGIINVVMKRNVKPGYNG
ncbi:MAG: carboxypeptidase regulatory-like domain-containing protein, partial [Bacteroidetes bacterium]|nr:carboxypeptidase regulatory-like domain-containing protein [Bacteroidota bacterium]